MQSNGLDMLSELAMSDGLRAGLVATGCLALVKAAMGRHLDDDDVQSNGRDILHELGKTFE